MNNPKFISLGPTCQTAGILDNCNLRSCSYPFDWCQSGYVHHKEIMQLPDESFYFRHIHSPAVHYQFIGNSDKDTNGHVTGQLQLPEIPYGYRSFYNPHRESGKEKPYFMRCIQRFHQDSFNVNLKKIYMLSDYTNKEGSIFLNDTIKISSLLEKDLKNYVRGPWLLLLYRITLTHDSSLASYSLHQVSNKTIMITESLPQILDTMYYKDIASCQYVNKAILINKRMAIRDAENFCLR